MVYRFVALFCRFPQLTGQLLLENLPVYCKATLKEELERRIGLESSFAISRCNTLSTDCLRDVEMIWKPEAVISPTELASDGHEIVACGDISGSITLLDVSSGKVIGASKTSQQSTLTMTSSYAYLCTSIYVLCRC